MFSPFIHLGVELGRALPVMRGKMLTVSFWKDGAAMLRNPDLMREAITNGYVKIGRQNLTEDISSMEREPELHPGRGLTSQAIGLAARPFGADARQAAMRAVDRMGDFVHGTLLWDRIAQLQAGIYLTTKKGMAAKGLDDRAAGIVAAHIANRYAGALPPESISSAGRKVANILMFSRSFTLGNLGVMKDAINGLPQDIRAQIARDSGQGMADKAQSLGRRKAFAGVVADIAMMYGMNAVAQAGIGALQQRKDDPDWRGDLAAKLGAAKHAGGAALDDILESLHRGMKHAEVDPVGAVLHPFDSLEAMSPTYRNEPGKGDRILVGHQPDGTAIYMRLPFGKIGEEMKGWLTRAFLRGEGDTPSMLEQKSSTLIRPFQYALSGDKGGGEKLYKPNDSPMVKAGKWVAELAKEQVPADTIAAAYRMLRGKGEAMDPYKFFGPLTGLTFSKGYPGGEEEGEIANQRREHQADVQDVRHDLKQAIRDGDRDAQQRLEKEAKMTPAEIKSITKSTLHPDYVSSRSMKLFQQTATDEQKERLKSAQAAKAQRFGIQP